MGRSRSASSSSSLSSSSSKWRFFNPAYYLKRPKRLVFLFIGFVIASLLFWDRQTLVREHEDEVSKLNEEVNQLKSMVRSLFITLTFDLIFTIILIS
uniref:Alpha-1 2-Mannosidase n=1 Tax=Rhizophora mucronata TaxID=61149 RepID=A0A2P2LVZ9_RHIMU